MIDEIASQLSCNNVDSQHSAMYLGTKRRRLLAVLKEKALWNKKKTTKKIIKLVLTCQACTDELLVET